MVCSFRRVETPREGVKYVDEELLYFQYVDVVAELFAR
jgi:hypothetical protein